MNKKEQKETFKPYNYLMDKAFGWNLGGSWQYKTLGYLIWISKQLSLCSNLTPRHLLHVNHPKNSQPPV